MENEKNALATFLRGRNIFTHYVDNHHSCDVKCRFIDPYGSGLYIVCMESLRVHGCKRRLDGRDPCIPTNDGLNVVCCASGREIIDQNIIDIDSNMRRMTANPFYQKINVPITQKQCQRADQTRRLWCVLGDVIHRIFQRERRERYNGLTENASRHYVEVVNCLFNDDSKTNIRAKLTKILACSTYRLSLGHVRLSRLLQLEKRCKGVLERALQNIETTKKLDFVYRNPHESCVYVVRCTLDGFKKGDVVVLNSCDFADLAPMPTQKGLQNAFEINTKQITTCSLILQEAFNKFN